MCNGTARFFTIIKLIVTWLMAQHGPLFEFVFEPCRNRSKEPRFLPGKNKHSNVGNSQCAISQEVPDSVIYFIQVKGDNKVEVYATRFIHSLIMNELRDDETCAVDLPSYNSKRDMYEQYCFNRGGFVKTDNKGMYSKVDDYTHR
jgi:hypothetical protein